MAAPGDALQAEGGVPFFAAFTPRSTCARCDGALQVLNFLQGPKPERGKPKDYRLWHYDCDDPWGEEPWEVAREDERREEARGHKSETTTYRRHVKRR